MKLMRAGLAICVLTLLSGNTLRGNLDSALYYNPQHANSLDGIVRTGIMVGAISNFGSIIVNGVSYSTDNATITIDGLPGIEADLDVGQTVTLKGSISDDFLSGMALTVTYNDNVSGPIQSIDIENGSLVVLGQPVRIDGSTSFDESIPSDSIEDLVIGNLVEVTGLVDTSGVIAATRIARVPDSSPLEILGTITNLNEVEQSFTLNAAVVDFSAATFEDVTGGQLKNGILVEVRGAEFNASGELLANRVIQLADTIVGAPGDRIEIQGFITVFASPNKFTVDTNQVKLTASTIFEDGNATDLALNTRLEVEGFFNPKGIIVASKVKFYQPPVIRIEAPIGAIDATAGTLEVLGIAVEVTLDSRLEDKSDQELSPLSLQDLSPGDYVDIRGVERFDSVFNIRATIIERDDPDNRVRLQGFVQAITEPTIQILDVNCDTTGADFYSVTGTQISAEDFFNQVTEGSLVKVRGIQTGVATLLADKVEFELPD